MNKFYFLKIFTFLLFLQFANANELSLKKNMKQIGKNMKIVNSNFEDSSMKKEVIEKIMSSIELLSATEKQIPEKIETLEKDKQQEQFHQYQDLIRKQIDLLQNLKTSLEQNDLVKSKEILSEINSNKKKGHKQFEKESD